MEIEKMSLFLNTSTPKDDDEVINAVSVAVLDRLSGIEHGAPQRVQQKKRLNVTPRKSVSSANYNNNIDYPSQQPVVLIV